MKPEREITFAIQICECIIQERSLLVFSQIRMENDVDECLQTVVRDLFGFYKIPDRILLLKQGVQVDRASCFVELVFDSLRIKSSILFVFHFEALDDSVAGA